MEPDTPGSTARPGREVLHELNNQIAVIFHSAALATSRLGEEDEVRTNLERISSAAERAGELTKQLRDTSDR